MIYIDLNDLSKCENIGLSQTVFPDGTKKYFIDSSKTYDFLEDGNYIPGVVEIDVAIKSHEDLFSIALIKDVLENLFMPNKLITYQLGIKYLMYQQDDRRFSDTESFGLKIIIDYINSLGFDSITVDYPHTEQVYMFNNYYDNRSFFNFYTTVITLYTKSNMKDFVWVIPDNGAFKKQIKIIDQINKLWDIDIKYVVANKSRDFKTNETTTQLSVSDLGGMPCVIFDDICLGGRTFTNLATELKKANCGNLYLVVPHGIFNNGVDHLFEHFTQIFTSNSVCTQKHKDLIIINC